MGLISSGVKPVFSEAEIGETRSWKRGLSLKYVVICESLFLPIYD